MPLTWHSPGPPQRGPGRILARRLTVRPRLPARRLGQRLRLQHARVQPLDAVVAEGRDGDLGDVLGRAHRPASASGPGLPPWPFTEAASSGASAAAGQALAGLQPAAGTQGGSGAWDRQRVTAEPVGQPAPGRADLHHDRVQVHPDDQRPPVGQHPQQLGRDDRLLAVTVLDGAAQFRRPLQRVRVADPAEQHLGPAGRPDRGRAVLAPALLQLADRMADGRDQHALARRVATASPAGRPGRPGSPRPGPSAAAGRAACAGPCCRPGRPRSAPRRPARGTAGVSGRVVVAAGDQVQRAASPGEVGRAEPLARRRGDRLGQARQDRPRQRQVDRVADAARGPVLLEHPLGHARTSAACCPGGSARISRHAAWPCSCTHS